MKNSPLLTLPLLVVLMIPQLSWGEDFLLYTPKPSAGNTVPASPDQGVLVKSILVKRGDTLRDLSRKHLGVASWFPQVLLFNSIKNPDLIYPGEKLLVPVRAGHPHAATKKAAKSARRHAARAHHPRHHAASKISTTKASTTESRPVAGGEQETYQQAKLAYVKGDYRKSLELFDSFLRRFPDSKLAADASLYRADCYLRLSGR